MVKSRRRGGEEEWRIRGLRYEESSIAGHFLQLSASSQRFLRHCSRQLDELMNQRRATLLPAITVLLRLNLPRQGYLCATIRRGRGYLSGQMQIDRCDFLVTLPATAIAFTRLRLRERAVNWDGGTLEISSEVREHEIYIRFLIGAWSSFSCKAILILKHTYPRDSLEEFFSL